MTFKKILGFGLAAIFLAGAGIAVLLMSVSSNLPKLITVADYAPLLVSSVYDKDGEQIGEFFLERREVVPYEKIPPLVVYAFVSAEDDTFFEHGGINYLAIFRAVLANLRAGRKVQGGSTITQQVAKSLLLTPEKTYIRKIREALLAYRMEANLSKQDILYLYLNQIYFGQGAYGISLAAKTYFRKNLEDLSIAEIAMLAGLPQAPSRYSPVHNPTRAKERQVYVINRLREENYITQEQAQQAKKEPVKVYYRADYAKKAPFFVETLRQLLVERLGEDTVLNKGLKIYTGLDITLQESAQESLRLGLRELDKRQGYRGAQRQLKTPAEVDAFLLAERDRLMQEAAQYLVIPANGVIPPRGPLAPPDKKNTLSPYLKERQIVPGVVTAVDDKWGLVMVRFAENVGLIDLETMKWARKPDPEQRAEYSEISKPSVALKVGDVIDVRIVGKAFSSPRIEEKLTALRKAQSRFYQRPSDLPLFNEFARLELEQEPVSEASLISFDQRSEHVLAMVGGYDFEKSEFNRALQAARQTGSAFKALVYTAALDKGFTPATPVIDAPLVYQEEKGRITDEGQEEITTTKWKPQNHSEKFAGDILFRNALIQSLNVPTVKIVESIGLPWVANYARRLGIFSPLNMDFTLGLGSSGVTLYEMTKVFAEFGRLGKRIRPILIDRVLSKEGEVLLENLTLDTRFEKELKAIDEEFEKQRLTYLAKQQEAQAQNLQNPNAGSTSPANPGDSPNLAGNLDGQNAQPKPSDYTPQLFFEDPDQLIKPQTAYLISTLLQGVINEPGGTGAPARALGRPLAGKTGTTNGYYDAWFIGYSAQIATGVWVGNDSEATLGKSEVGTRAALPIWLEYMKVAHNGLPIENFPVPDGIVFANIDNETGRLASTRSKRVVRQAFAEGTEPQQSQESVDSHDDTTFYKEDLSE